ncbi:MAG: ribosome-associated translation inhibitor RaiA [Acidobacteria bacterium]|nr:ribosome-associated translation inhibitor RaiA [Acidobacteriota bacterium]
MNINYTGGNGEFTDKQKERLESRLAKLSKMVDNNGGSKDAHIVLTDEKRGKRAEVTVNYLHTSFVAEAKGPAYLPAVMDALDKLEKQISKVRKKIRDGKRDSFKPSVEAAAEAAKPAPRDNGPRVFAAKISKKPMNVDEAVLVSIRKSVSFVAFRDAETEGISVVVRRADGDFDLIRA